MKNINIILALAACALLSPACKFISAEGVSDTYDKSGEKVSIVLIFFILYIL